MPFMNLSADKKLRVLVCGILIWLFADAVWIVVDSWDFWLQAISLGVWPMFGFLANLAVVTAYVMMYVAGFAMEMPKSIQWLWSAKIFFGVVIPVQILLNIFLWKSLIKFMSNMEATT